LIDVNCFAGCETEDVLAKARLTSADMSAPLYEAVSSGHVGTGNEQASVDSHSWLPRPLVGAPPVEPPSVSDIFYPGKHHLLSGSPDSGKSMLVHQVEAEQIRRGRCVVHVDFEQGPSETLQRLHALGLTDEQIERYFLYIEPTEPINDFLSDLLALIEERRPVLVVFDSLGSLAELHGLDDNRRGDVQKLFRAIITPIAKAGPAVVYVDHLAKDPEASKVFAIGSERKVGLSDVHLRVEVVEGRPLGRGRRGVLKVTAMRDRSGYLPRGKKIAEAIFDSDESGVISARLDLVEHSSEEQGKPFRPTRLMERVSHFLEGCVEPQSRNAIETNVTGKNGALRHAMDVLLREGYVREVPGDRTTKALISVRPYREADGQTEAA
jgi:hypothetical protein